MTIARAILTWFVSLALSVPAMADTTFVVAGALVDTIDERLIDHPVIEIDGNRIVSVTSNGVVPDGATVIDVGDATLVPGLADVHAHLGWYATDTNYSFLGVSHTDEAVRSVINAEVLLMAGFSMVSSTCSQCLADVSVCKYIEEGRIPGPRLKGVGASPGVFGRARGQNLPVPPVRVKKEGS